MTVIADQGLPVGVATLHRALPKRSEVDEQPKAIALLSDNTAILFQLVVDTETRYTLTGRPNPFILTAFCSSVRMVSLIRVAVS
jgi:hypothetical protein